MNRVGGEIESPARPPRPRLRAVGRRAIGMRKQRRLRHLHDIGDDAAALLPGVHDMEDITGFAAKPADIEDRRAARQDADIGALVRLPGIGRTPAPRAIHAADQRQDREKDMARGDDEIMRYAGARRLETLEAGDHSLGVDHAKG